MERGQPTFPLAEPWPCLRDRYEQGGLASGQYFHQDLLVAQLIHDARPARHVDVGSRVDGFVAHVASYRQVDVLDIRAVDSSPQNIRFHRVDVSADVSEFAACTDSLSCLHALEHFGLGRYGDDLDPEGWSKGFDNLGIMLEDGGRLYLSLPLGQWQRVEFDAHRVFSLPFLLEQIDERGYAIEHFSYVDDAGRLHRDVQIDEADRERSYGLHLGLAIFALRKLPR
jgi:hypothetical protein